jgi:GDPmannose 4,6-dehydratase
LAKPRIDHLGHGTNPRASNLLLEYGDMADGSSLRNLLRRAEPDEIYNLAAQSHVQVSFDTPEYTADVTGLGALRVLEATKDYVSTTGRTLRLYQASSSEMFGSAPPRQDEHTPLRPRSPYAIAKAAAFWHTVNCRQTHGLHCSNGILFNHESERRGENFVTRKITLGAGRIKVGLQDFLYLGNLEARRDWGYAPDYVEAMWLMLQQPKPDDYVIATGESHSVREFAETAFGLLDLDWQDFVRTDPRYLRAAEVDHLEGNPAKARRTLGWRPTADFRNLVRRMTEHDLDLAEREAHARGFTRRDRVNG